MTKALLYCREFQAEGSGGAPTLDAQETALTDEATRRGYTYEVVRDDGGASESVTGRDKLVGVLDLLDAHEAQVLMAVRMESIARNQDEARSIRDRSQAMGWGIIISGERLGGSRGSTRASALSAEYIAEERRSHADRTREGMARRKAEGAILGRSVDSTFLATYREVLAMVGRGDSYNSIARTLNEQGIATSKGGKWYASTIKAMVESETAKRLNARDVG